jgi:hypothetical protein
MLDYLADLDRIGAPGDQAAPLHVSIAVARIMRALSQLPEVNRAADAVKTIRIVTGNLFAMADWEPGPRQRGNIARPVPWHTRRPAYLGP